MKKYWGGSDKIEKHFLLVFIFATDKIPETHKNIYNINKVLHKSIN